MPSNILTGIDFYDATFHQNRGAFIGAPPIHMYDLSQQTVAAYWQQSIGILPTTDFSYGGRIQHFAVTARDRLDPTAPNYFGDAQAMPLDSGETQHALHIGLEHRFNDVFSVFGRAAHAFRTPNVDDRVLAGPAFDPSPSLASRQLCAETQTSNDIEGGFRIKVARSRCNPASTTWNSNNEILLNRWASSTTI